MLARLDSIEAQLSRLTARSEVNENAIAMLQDPPRRLEASGAPAAGDAAPAQPTGAIEVPDTDAPAAKASAKKGSAATAAKADAKPGAARLPRSRPSPSPIPAIPATTSIRTVSACGRPGCFPEAQQQLKLYVDKYPNDPKISYGRNLLGRAYLQDKQPGVAASYFLQNYQKDPSGARAPDSLLFLAESMLALKDNARACRALAEFSDKYPEFATGRLQNEYDKDRAQAACK